MARFYIELFTAVRNNIKNVRKLGRKSNVLVMLHGEKRRKLL